MIDGLHWLGHSGFRWEGSKVVYFDPWKLSKKSKKADIVCVSHEHFDHCSGKDIALIISPNTIIVTCPAAAKKLSSLKNACAEIRPMAPGDSANLNDVEIKAIASYNINKEFHPKDTNKLGFVVTMDGISVYHAGDTDRIPEMDGLKCDVALLPISGTYVMSAVEAAEAAIAIGPKTVVPMHYGDIVGTTMDARRFEDALKGKIEVKILGKEE